MSKYPARKLCVSPNQLLDELGGAGGGAGCSSMSTYINRLGDETARARILRRQISEAQSHIELRFGVFMYQTRVVTRPVAQGAQRGVDYDVEEDGYPYTRHDFRFYGTVYLRRRPVVSIARAGIRLGNSHEQLAANEWPQGWVNPEQRLGVLHILPILGSGGDISTTSAILLPIIAGHFPGNISVPLIFSVDYTAGFLPTDFDPDEDDPTVACPDFDPNPLIKAIRYKAAANMLGIMGRLVAPGGGSIGIDGFSQSWGASRFAQEQQDYLARVEEELALMETQFPLTIMGI